MPSVHKAQLGDDNINKENIMNQQQPIAIIGAGAWGTALAIHLAKNQQIVHLWDRNTHKLNEMRKNRAHPHLPGIHLIENIHIESTPHKALANVRDIMIAVSSAGFRSVLETIQPLLTPEHRILWATKGLEQESNLFCHEIIEDVCGPRAMAVLSGPSFAQEVAGGLPTAVVIAANNQTFLNDLTLRFNNTHFRVYSNNDLVGVELGGAIKNVLAIATGMSDGLGFGANARAALITRGIAEMQQLYTALGAQPETLLGLAGVGDLILTCTDNQSRNRRFGMLLGQGQTREEALANVGQSVEGLHAAHTIHHLTQKYQLFMPICEQVYHVVMKKTTPRQAAMKLLERTTREE